jgi:hypothetical protein
VSVKDARWRIAVGESGDRSPPRLQVVRLSRSSCVDWGRRWAPKRPVEPEGSVNVEDVRVSVRRRSVEHRKMLGLAESNAVKDRSPSRTVRRTSSLERLGRDAKLPGERPRAFG